MPVTRAQARTGGADQASVAQDQPSTATEAVQAVKDQVKAAASWAESHGTGDRNGAWGLSGNAGAFISLVGTVILLLCCPAFALCLWYTLTQLDGSLLSLAAFVKAGGPSALWHAWPRPSLEAWTYLAAFGSLEAFLQLAVPGAKFLGPVTPKGNTPVYKANGVLSWLTTMALFFGGWRFGLFNPARVYDLLGEILAALNIFSLLFCAFLFVKGYVAPSSSDSGTTGSLVYDFYWGMELYPRIGKHFDLKTWTNCRMGMMGWSVLTLCYCAKQQQMTGSVSDSMLVSVLLMQIYIFKFFLWETGYWRSLDIMHDRAGYYICWGCLVWVPAIYTSPAMWLVTHPIHLGRPAALAIFAAGCAAIYINYDSDRQRQLFRATSGRARVWGRVPKKVTASYTTADGETKQSLLLASGWWGLARHFHYTPEILAAFFWTLPGGMTHVLPWFYVFFLTLLLTDRAFRDDVRCGSKYGADWQRYCKLVPYRMVPGIF